MAEYAAQVWFSRKIPFVFFWKSALAASERMEDAPQTRRFVHSGHAFHSGGI